CFDELFVALERVKNGEIYTGNVIRNLLGRSKREIQSFFLEMDLRKTLTKVELQVLLDVSSGYLSKQIAARRFRSIETIHTQRKVLKRKLGLTGTDHLVRFSAHMRDQIRTILYLMESPLVERIASESEE
ncbi:MAG: LuxR C-terminal-related transcriptional regulator, partial [Balneolaceae bacterium]